MVDEPRFGPTPAGVLEGETGQGLIQPLAAREKLGDEVARTLRKLIMSGGFAAGDKMRAQELAVRLGVSTQPVREALITLSNEGLLDVLPHRGFRVTSISKSDLVDVFSVHAFVAGNLAAKAAEVATPDQIAQLSGLQDQMQRSASDQALGQQAARIEQLNFEFHRLINHIPNANRLRWFLRAATRYIPEELYGGWLTGTINDHVPIIAALAAHDSERARELVERHVIDAGKIVLNRLATQGSANTPLNIGTAETASEQ